MGDGTNLVLVLAGELLQQGQDLLKMGLHPSEVITGFIQAGRYAADILDSLSCGQIEATHDSLARIVKSVVASKQYGYEDMITKLVCEACMQVMPKKPGLSPSCNS